MGGKSTKQLTLLKDVRWGGWTNHEPGLGLDRKRTVGGASLSLHVDIFHSGQFVFTFSANLSRFCYLFTIVNFHCVCVCLHKKQVLILTCCVKHNLAGLSWLCHCCWPTLQVLQLYLKISDIFN